MNLDAVLASGRGAAEERMRERVRLYAQEPDTFDRGSGSTTPGARTTLYEGKARVKAVAQAAGEEKQAGERELQLLDYTVALPWATPLDPGVRVLPGMRVEVLTSPDARMVGLILWVTGVQFSDQATAWRIKAEDRS